MQVMKFPFPEVNATLNGISMMLLTVGFILIKNGKRQEHRATMMSALGVSILFLISYVTYHIQVGARTPFNGIGMWRPIYYAMLISHIILAAVIVPLVIRTFYLGMTNRFAQHQRWAKWIFPLWYYVSITGVLIYFFLYQWF
jgi:putative membrane protein